MGRVITDSILNTKPFERGIGKMRKSVGKFQSFFATIGIGVGITGIAALTRSVLDSAEKIESYALRLDTTSESIQRLGFVARQNKTDLDTLANALTRLTRKVAAPTVQIENALRTLGIELQTFQRLTVEGKLEALAKGFAGAENRAEAFAALFPLMEDDAKKLLPLFEKLGGSGGSLEKLAEGFGGIVSNADIARLNEAKDSISALSDEISGNLAKSLAAVIPLIDEFGVSTGFAAAPVTFKALADTYFDFKKRLLGGEIEPKNLLVELIDSFNRAKEGAVFDNAFGAIPKARLRAGESVEPEAGGAGFNGRVSEKDRVRFAEEMAKAFQRELQAANPSTDLGRAFIGREFVEAVVAAASGVAVNGRNVTAGGNRAIGGGDISVSPALTKIEEEQLRTQKEIRDKIDDVEKNTRATVTDGSFGGG